MQSVNATELSNVITRNALQICLQRIAPGENLSKEEIRECLKNYSPQELLLVLVDAFNEEDGAPKIYDLFGKKVPVEQYILRSWYNLRGYDMPVEDVDVYATVGLDALIDGLDVADFAIGHAVTEGFISERKMVNAEL